MVQPIDYKYCDVVMKGGITSGIVYPLAVSELAKEYRFKNIGGTSAGAIAAVITAAAEYGRRCGNADAFSLVADLPQQLGSNGLLVKLFQPSPKTARIFKTGIAILNAKSNGKKLFAGATSLIGLWGVAAALLFVLTMLLLPAVALFICRGRATPYIVLIALWILFWGLVVTCYFALRGSVDETAANKLGLCTGFDPRAAAGKPPLTNWLHHQIQAAAGRGGDDAPLTVGDLWNAPAYDGETLKTEHTITLEVVTTSLTQGHPFTIPFKTNIFYFDEQEFRELFPSSVVDWLVLKQRPLGSDRHPLVNTTEGKPLRRLPLPADTPVLLAARMSLSFPILLSAIPLYAVDFTLKKNNEAPKNQPVVADRCWFSDGGISSNFPIQFFDSPLPRWPTFGIDLKAPHPDHSTEEADFVWLPTRPGGGSGTQVRWNDFDQGQGLRSLVGFAAAIINTMQNWRDNLQATAAGYRERIVHVSLRPDEGGLNLTMPPELLATLSKRGLVAGQKLRNDFDLCTHIWARYRLTMCSLGRYLDALRESWSHPVSEDECGWKLINGTNAPSHYCPNDAECRALQAALYKELQDLLKLSGSWTAQHFCKDSPHPEAILRGQPKF
jgi:predicted acylesterase/phospholipase RssA